MVMFFDAVMKRRARERLLMADRDHESWAESFRPVDSIDEIVSNTRPTVDEVIVKNERIFADYVKGLR